MQEIIIYSDSARGVYIPQHFAETINRYAIAEWSKWIHDLDRLCLGPDTCEDYWDIWCNMLDNLVVYDREKGLSYVLYQDGDLFLVPEDQLETWLECEV